MASCVIRCYVLATHAGFDGVIDRGEGCWRLGAIQELAVLVFLNGGVIDISPHFELTNQPVKGFHPLGVRVGCCSIGTLVYVVNIVGPGHQNLGLKKVPE